MVTALYILHVLVCLAMLPIILLQSGKGGGVSAVFGGGGSGNVFGSRGASNFLTRMTTGAAIIFMVTSLGLSWASSQNRSVVADVPAAPAPDADPAAGVGTPAADLEASPGAEAPAADETPAADLDIQLGNPSAEGAVAPEGSEGD